MTDEGHEFASVRPPLSVRGDREATRKFYEMREGVSRELRRAMLAWLYRALEERKWSLDRFARINEIEVLDRDSSYRRWEVLEAGMQDSDKLLLTVVDHALESIASDSPFAIRMESYLVDARSVWRVGEDADGRWQLECRQPPELTRLADKAASDSERAGEHLRAAWAKAFARDSDPAGAVHAANKAVEVAAKPVVIPDDPTATTGKMLQALRDKPDKWISDLGPGGVSAVVELMDAVWNGQLRHGDESQPAAESDETAEMIVHASVLLVHWFQSGRIRRSGAR